MPTIMISCGEASGDAYAGALTRELRRLRPDLGFTGFGGDNLRAAGADLVGDFRGLTVTGLVEAIRVLPRAWRMQRALVARMDRERPAALVVIDFPDFNFPLAAQARKRGIPVVYYVCPQLWAWRTGRVRTLKAVATRALVIFPFEPAFFHAHDVPVEFVGHPLLDLVPPPADRAAVLAGAGLRPDAPTVALLPGSRPNEVASTMRTLVDAIPLIRAREPRAQFLVARAPSLPDRLFASLPLGSDARTAILTGRADDVLSASDVVITASGTATVQTALHEKPMVIVYRLSPLSYQLGRHFVHVETFGMVNLVAGETVATELIQDAFTPEAVARETLAVLMDPERAARVRASLRAVKARLGEPGASRRAALRVLEASGLQRSDVGIPVPSD
ncbi:MAG: lipid-A-disaccharide synthase [Vicinamibacterales bacterium]|nr:lipid-A-disaccharide synthase [Vicinamibacterales bacterium]